MILTCLLTMLRFMLMGKKSEVEPKLQTDGNNSKSEWAKHHKMQIRYDKTSCMTLGSRHRTQNEASKLDITIDGNEIKQVDKQKLLGVYIDENLLWTAHIDYLCSTISTKISLLKQLSTYVPVKVIIIIIIILYFLQLGELQNTIHTM